MGQYERALFEARRLTPEARGRLALELLRDCHPEAVAIDVSVRLPMAQEYVTIDIVGPGEQVP